MKLDPIPSNKVLDLYYLDTRCSLLEIAAFLDRLDRGNVSEAPDDVRHKKIRAALDVLTTPHASPNRAEELLNLFS